MPKKHIIVSVTNDLSTDNRVDKVCRSLLRMGFDVTAVGRELPESSPIERAYCVERLHLWFRRGPLFYAEYNIRLSILLWRLKPDILLANDLDTLVANYLVHINRRGGDLVYDSHEYFTEVPELQGRMAQKVWLAIERWIFPKLQYVYTVNRSIAGIYEGLYKKVVKVVRNIPERQELIPETSRAELGLPLDKRILILQGAGINIDRGAEEAVLAMADLGTDYLLLIIGSGDAIGGLKRLVDFHGLQDRVSIKGRLPYAELMQYTRCADLGLTLDKDSNPNYRFSLPNKLFDYISAGIPVLASDLIEIKQIITSYKVGRIVDEVEPTRIAVAVKQLLDDEAAIAEMRINTVKASTELTWEKEERVLRTIFEPLA